ncbi:hypothetical protein BH10BAC3_BH10BAC3_04520 [soil metagenome]
MKTLTLYLACFVFLILPFCTHAQKYTDLRPQNRVIIPFGQTLPAPIIHDKDGVAHNHHKTEINSISNYATKEKKTANGFLNFHLTKDINTISDSDPRNILDNSHSSFAMLNNVCFFSADDGIHGGELWKSDGTVAGTYLVNDIYPGIDGSDIREITAANGLIFFSAFTEENGYEPWISDGTTAGTHLLKDIKVGADRSSPKEFVAVNSEVFFAVDDYAINTQLWKTDGTDAGTVMVKDLVASGIGYNMSQLTACNDLLYFAAGTGSAGFQLFRSDGTNAGTSQVKQIVNYGYYTGPMQLTPVNNKLFFSIDDGTGRKLLVTDGTEIGTTYAPGNGNVFMQAESMDYSNAKPFKLIGNDLFIAGYTVNEGSGLYKYNVSGASQIELVKDLTALNNVVDYIVPNDITIVNDRLYFKVISYVNGLHDELWVSNGAADNTQIVKTFAPGENINSFLKFGSNLYFVKTDNVYGTELWKTNGTETGTVLVKDINAGAGSSTPDYLTVCSGKLLFQAADYIIGSELWQSDLTSGGTSLLKDINVTSTESSYAGALYKSIVSTGDGVIFNAMTPAFGAELYKSDGTEAGTVMLNDIAPGSDWSYPNSFLYKNKATYFQANELTAYITGNYKGVAIYKSNGQSSGLQRVTAYLNLDKYSFRIINFNVTDRGEVYFILYNHSNFEYELWYSNGTETSATMLKTGLYYGNYIVTVGNLAFFVAGDDEHGFELWKSDGTMHGTKMVNDINPGSDGSYPYSLVSYKNKLFFGAFDGNNYSFWTSDGTEKHTTQIKNIEPSYYDYEENYREEKYCISDGSLYFTGIDYAKGEVGLWKTNGTEAGTSLVKNINPGGSGYLYNLTDVNGTLFFTGNDGIHGEGLWKSNGKPAGTVFVKEITPYPLEDYGHFNGLCNAGGKLYFLNYSTYPAALWSSDGTAGNTKQVEDEGLNGLSEIDFLTGTDSKLFFSAYSNKYGTELYVGDVSGKKMQATSISSSIVTAEKLGSTFDASLFPNPSHGNSTLMISGDVKNVSIVITDISGKTIWNKVYRDQHTINMPLAKMAAGIYLVTVRNNIESKVLKFIKE